jgi:hypothetical protein
VTKTELKIQLINNKVPEEVYSLDGGNPNEAYCISYHNGIWETYYSERGLKSEKQEFMTEDEACSYFYNWLIESLENMGII